VFLTLYLRAAKLEYKTFSPVDIAESRVIWTVDNVGMNDEKTALSLT